MVSKVNEGGRGGGARTGCLLYPKDYAKNGHGKFIP